ncbi:hypothetical protein ARSEF4850_003046 [Beauveria asiatica]
MIEILIVDDLNAVFKWSSAPVFAVRARVLHHIPGRLYQGRNDLVIAHGGLTLSGEKNTSTKLNGSYNLPVQDTVDTFSSPWTKPKFMSALLAVDDLKNDSLSITVKFFMRSDTQFGIIFIL